MLGQLIGRIATNKSLSCTSNCINFITRNRPIGRKGKADEAIYFRRLERIQMLKLRIKMAKMLGEESSDQTEKLKDQLEELEAVVQKHKHSK